MASIALRQKLVRELSGILPEQIGGASFSDAEFDVRSENPIVMRRFSRQNQMQLEVFLLEGLSQKAKLSFASNKWCDRDGAEVVNLSGRPACIRPGSSFFQGRPSGVLEIRMPGMSISISATSTPSDLRNFLLTVAKDIDFDKLQSEAQRLDLVCSMNPDPVSPSVTPGGQSFENYLKERVNFYNSQN